MLFTYVQFRYEHHFSERLKSSVDLAEKLTHEKSVPEREARTVIDTAVDQARLRFDDVRRRVLLHALIFAGIGEITAALGGVTLSGIRSLIVD